jgi:hypothetical protein
LHIKFLGSNSSQYLMFLNDLDGLVDATTATPSSLPLGRDLDALVPLPPLPLPLLPSLLLLLEEAIVELNWLIVVFAHRARRG